MKSKRATSKPSSNMIRRRVAREGVGKSRSKKKRVPHSEKSRGEMRDLARALDEAQKLIQLRGLRADGYPEAGFITSKKLAYEELIVNVRDTVHATLPLDATVAVINKGDPELLKLDGRRAWHFPRANDGSYAGHHPPTSADAIEHLEVLRAEGATHLVIPHTSSWWLDFYTEFRKYLEERFTVAAHKAETCVIFSLRELCPPGASAIHRTAESGSDAGSDKVLNESDLRIRLARALLWLGRAMEAHSVLAQGLRTEPLNAQLHLELMQLALSGADKAVADHHAQCALALGPDDYAVNLGLAKAAWQQGKMADVEARLLHLTHLFPDDTVAQNELVQFYCVGLERKNHERTLADRLLACITASSRRRLITPINHLRIAEVLGVIPRFISIAVESLRSALDHCDPSSQALQDFTARLLRPVVADRSAIPFHDKAAFAAFLTHAGNGFAAVQDLFSSQASYHLALKSGTGKWNSATHAASVNLAFIEMAHGAVIPALEYLQKVSRIYPVESARILWPTQRGSTWPHAPFDLSDHFDKLKPSDAVWPKITVITPSFNQAAYVEETMLSVLNQHYPSLEYIVVDGASTDGTIEILERYRPRIDRLIIERDEGQTDALNKGLHAATGDLLLWINSDDMLGPGALFMIALTWIEEKADVIAGFCCEHTDRRFGLINLPAVSHATFNIECLGDIFHYWLKGHYFYQPEVAFSRRIFEKAGGSLDKSLYFTMDYEFWLRCAAAGATLSVVHWPIGLFRKHDQQKTADLDRTIIEQGAVRDRFVIPRPGIERILEVRRRLQRCLEKRRPSISVVSTRVERIFSSDIERQLRETFSAEGLDVRFHDGTSSIKSGSSDLVIMLVHLHKEQEILQRLRESGHQGAVAGWFWDNHHHVDDNYAASKAFDACIPGHAFASSYLRSPRHIFVEPVPLCVTQWSDDEASQWMPRHGFNDRADRLYGGFVRYEFARKRNLLLEKLIEDGTDGIYLLEENQLSPYFGKSPEDRFAHWASHKVSLCLPLAGDLSQRLFDALLAGQIPIVPRDVYDLDKVIPPAMQSKLPIIRIDDYSVATVKRAHEEALRAFNRDGAKGVRRRHAFVLQNHMFTSRIRTIITAMRGLSAGRTKNEEP